MLNAFYYLNHAAENAETAGRFATAADMPVAHVVDCGVTDILSLLRQQYGVGGNYPFCLALRGETAEIIDAGRCLLLFLFHPYYDLIEGTKPLFIYAPSKERGNIRKGLNRLFDGQRLQVSIYFPDGWEPATGSSEPAVRTISKKNTQGYYDYCLTTYSPRDIFLLEDAADTMAVVLQADMDIRADHPLIYRLAREGSQARNLVIRLTREKTQLAEESLIRQQLLEAGSRHNEVEYILRFYKNEYEILPLWYKRLGHIIKVLQGKRSFRSLYDKRVKKYKE